MGFWVSIKLGPKNQQKVMVAFIRVLKYLKYADTINYAHTEFIQKF